MTSTLVGRPRGKSSLALAVSLALALLLLAAPARAQYMYLDSNGDGIHTAADVLSGTGTNTVDLWIDTAHNRDGSTAVCNVEPGTEMTINSYEVVLHATGGTVLYGTPVNRQDGMTTHFAPTPLPMNSTDLYDGWGGGYAHPPGVYRLWTVPVTAVTGTPSLTIAPSTPIYWGGTEFGCRCSGNDFDNTYKLVGTLVGTGDFTDVDGLPYSATTPPNTNTAPVIEQPPDMVAVVGETTSQLLTAHDAEGNEIRFSRDSGPDYVHVYTTDPGRGTGIGRVSVRPVTANIGSASVTVAATDGIDVGRATFQVTVVAGSNHAPRLAAPGMIRVEAGAVAREAIYASDSDGDALALYKAGGPAYATVESPGAGSGGVYGSVVLAPTACDIGSSSVTIGASDGTSAVERAVAIQVVEPRPLPSPAIRTFAAGRYSTALRAGDWNEDGHLDLAVVSEVGRSVAIGLGDGDGNLALKETHLIDGYPSYVAYGDWDRDGHADLAVSGFGGSVNIFKGAGDGTFQPGQSLVVPLRVEMIAADDFDQDGALDLIVGGEGYAVALGRGDGTFAFGPLQPLTARATSMALGDFNRDGLVDFAVPVGRSVRVELGLGDGFFMPGPVSTVEEEPFTVVSAEMNGDGVLDLATFGWDARIGSIVGDGTGAFAPGGVIDLGFAEPWTGTVGDWDGDGATDAITAAFGTGTVYAHRGDGHGGLIEPPVLTIREPGASMGIETGDFNEDGRLDIAYVSRDIAIALNTRAPKSAVVARTFLLGGANNLALVSSARQVPFYLEPVDGNFELASVDLASIRLHSEGTGSVDVIAPTAGKTPMIGDADENGVQEIPVRFAMADLVKLFDKIQGRQEVSVSLEGALTTGGNFCSRLTLNVQGVGPANLAVSVAPNPLNPTGVLSFETTRPGPIQVRVYDLQGRLTRVLLDTPRAEARRYALPINGVDGAGRRLASGVYFFRVNADGVERKGRFIVLK